MEQYTRTNEEDNSSDVIGLTIIFLTIQNIFQFQNNPSLKVCITRNPQITM